jgi:hypothetical protein
MKCAILENLSTTTKTESLPLLVLCKPKTKSIEILVQGSLGIGKGVQTMGFQLRLSMFTRDTLITDSFHITFHMRPKK